MIRAVTWFSPDHCGTFAPGAKSSRRKSPATASSDQMLAFIEHPLKYFSRMTRESRSCLGAACLAIRACGWEKTELREIGLVAAGYGGCLAADENYFNDYAAGGRSVGRGNLFIYTLPSSTMGEVAIALGLKGPTLHLHDADQPVQEMVRQAQILVDDGEAEGILALWSDVQAAVCFAVDGTRDDTAFQGIDWNQSPMAMAQGIAAMVQDA